MKEGPGVQFPQQEESNSGEEVWAGSQSAQKIKLENSAI